MKEIAELFYKAYLKHNFKSHEKPHQEFEDALDKLLVSLSDEQKQLYLRLENEQLDFMEAREIKIIEYIFKLFLPEEYADEL